jgi:hypothetical protein
VIGDPYDQRETLAWLDAVEARCRADGLALAEARQRWNQALLAPLRRACPGGLVRATFLDGTPTDEVVLDGVEVLPTHLDGATEVEVELEAADGSAIERTVRFLEPADLLGVEGVAEVLAPLGVSGAFAWAGYGPRGAPGQDGIAAFLVEAARHTPNHFLKHPGPHRAWPVDREALTAARAALAAASQWGVLAPLARLLGVAEDGLDAATVEGVVHRVIGDGPEFGLGRVGMLVETGAELGDPLLPAGDCDVTSLWWVERGPWLPHRIVAAREILEAQDPTCRALEFDCPVYRWTEVLRCFEGVTLRSRPAWEDWPKAMERLWGDEIWARWEVYRAELARLAAIDGLVLTWSEEEGKIL